MNFTYKKKFQRGVIYNSLSKPKRKSFRTQTNRSPVHKVGERPSTLTYQSTSKMSWLFMKLESKKVSRALPTTIYTQENMSNHTSRRMHNKITARDGGTTRKVCPKNKHPAEKSVALYSNNHNSRSNNKGSKNSTTNKQVSRCTCIILSVLYTYIYECCEWVCMGKGVCLHFSA